MTIGQSVVSRILIAASMLGGAITLNAQSAASAAKEATAYNPLEVLSRFLTAAYPDLSDHQGLATLKTHFDGEFSLVGVEFEFHPCRMSGVSLKPVTLPYCGDRSAETKSFLTAQIDFAKDIHAPILTFTASGILIEDARIKKIQQMRRRLPRNWTKDQALEFLHSTQPQYGPEKDKEFAASLPVAAIEEVTGCHLHTNSATFEVNLEQVPRLQFYWTVRGKRNSEDAVADTGCWASFEPFAGHLIAMGNSTP